VRRQLLVVFCLFDAASACLSYLCGQLQAGHSQPCGGSRLYAADVGELGLANAREPEGAGQLFVDLAFAVIVQKRNADAHTRSALIIRSVGLASKQGGKVDPTPSAKRSEQMLPGRVSNGT
jgi:hypothetical protein